MEWLTSEGHLRYCPLEECKAVLFISESGRGDLFTANNLFERRPRIPGLWVRFAFRDRSILDGVLSQNLLEWPASGFYIVPPQARGGRQRVFIPRTAVTGTELMGVIGAGGSAGPKEKPLAIASPNRQIKLFES